MIVNKQLYLGGGWAYPSEKILVSWDDYSQYMMTNSQ